MDNQCYYFSVHPVLLSLQKWENCWYVLFYYSLFSLHDRVHTCMKPLLMVAENSIVRKYTILYNRWLPISWHLGSLFCHSKNTAINSLVANYFFRTNFSKKNGWVKRYAKWAWMWKVKLPSKKLYHFMFPPRKYKHPYFHTLANTEYNDSNNKVPIL